jgi:hypothetical protein
MSRGTPTSKAKRMPFLQRAADHHRRTGLEHRVDVQQEVRLLHEGAQRAGAPQLHAVARAVEHGGRPYPVEILVDEARRVRVRGIEALERLHVVERKDETPARGLCTHREETVERDRAADLVAVRERHRQDGGPGLAAIEDVDEFGAGTRAPVRLEVRGLQLDGDGHVQCLWLGSWS